MSNLEYRHVDAELRAAEDAMIVEGYAAKFHVESDPLGRSGVRESIKPGAFSRTLLEDKQYMHWNHDPSIVLASTKSGTLTLSEDEVGLKMRAELPDTQWGRDTYALVKRGDVSQMSFGFQKRADAWDDSDPKSPRRSLLDVRLFEVSIVPYPAYPQTAVMARSIDEELDEYRAATQPVPEIASDFDPDREAEYWRVKIKITGGSK